MPFCFDPANEKNPLKNILTFKVCAKVNLSKLLFLALTKLHRIGIPNIAPTFKF